MDYSFAHPLLVLKVCFSLQKHRDSLGCKLYQPDLKEPERTRNLWDGIIQTGFVHGCVHLLLKIAVTVGQKELFRSTLSEKRMIPLATTNVW